MRLPKILLGIGLLIAAADHSAAQPSDFCIRVTRIADDAANEFKTLQDADLDGIPKGELSLKKSKETLPGASECFITVMKDGMILPRLLCTWTFPIAHGRAALEDHASGLLTSFKACFETADVSLQSEKTSQSAPPFLKKRSSARYGDLKTGKAVFSVSLTDPFDITSSHVSVSVEKQETDAQRDARTNAILKRLDRKK